MLRRAAFLRPRLASKLCSLLGPDATALKFGRRWSSLAGPFGSSLFTGKGNQYTLDTSCAQRISHLLDHHRLNTWGFVIFRCTYDDNAAWTQFMDHLHRSRGHLSPERYGIENHDDDFSRDLVRRLDWRVQEDPIGLDGASKDEVRRRFRQLVFGQLQAEESDEPAISYMARRENPRWNFCVHADKDSVSSVLQDPLAGSTDQLFHHRYVNLIRADSDWDFPDYDRFDWSTHRRPEDPEEDDPHDENEEQIEGSRLYDVGWTKVQVDRLIPSLYDDLMKASMWEPLYVRPPEIARW